MTGQLLFDSHVDTISRAMVGLVNQLSPGAARGRDHLPPEGAARREVLAEVLVAMDGTRPRVGEADAASFADLAGRLHAVFRSVEAGDVDGAAVQVNALLSDTGARPRLDPDPQGSWGLHFHGSDDSLYLGWAAGCAAALAMAVGSDLLGRLGVCEAPACDRVYVDESRNAGRRFCSPRCQSRVKAAAHRARSAGA